MRSDEQPDLVMMLPYADVDLDDTPIVVLGCKGRHFFTVETLDGLIGMKDVYEFDPISGQCVNLKDNEQLAISIPQCPTCREPIRQYVTRRYNRVVNRAVIDEMSKRFVISGQQTLQRLTNRLRSVEKSLESTRPKLLPTTDISKRYVQASNLEKDARAFLRIMDERNKPSHKLREAIQHVASKHVDLNDSMAQLSVSSTSASKQQDSDQRITLGGQLYHLEVRQLVLVDKFEILRNLKSRSVAAIPSFPGGSPVDRSVSFLQDCLELTKACKSANSIKLAVQATLAYADMLRLLGASKSGKEATVAIVLQYRDVAKALLEEAERLCNRAFQGRDQLRKGVEQSLQLLGREFYAEVSKEEFEAIKQAMVSGRGGIASHSGHWYQCLNGHPVSRSKTTSVIPTDKISLPLVNVVCQWNVLVAQNVESPLVVKTIRQSQGLLEQPTWNRRET